jgi:hypothetical protein
MSDLVVSKLMDGSRQAFLHVDIVGDDDGDLVDRIVIDPEKTFDPNGGKAPTLCIDKIMYALIGCDCRLEFEYEAGDVPVWTLPRGSGAPDFGWCGSLPDRATEMGGSGRLKLTTIGLRSGGFGSIIIAVTKKN